MDSEKNAARKRRRFAFTCDEKMKLLNEVKSQSVIWDLSHPEHFNHFALNTAWRKISNELGKSTTECKAAWNSLKDSRRYHLAVKKKKSGGDLLDMTSVSDDIQWQFAESMDFLPNMPAKKPTIKAEFMSEPSDTSTELMFETSAMVTVDNQNVDNQNDTSMVSPCTLCGSISGSSSYFYKEPKKETSCSSAEDNLVDKLSENVAQKEKESMKYETQYKFIDTLLKQLPEDQVQDLFFDMIDRIRTAFRKKESDC